MCMAYAFVHTPCLHVRLSMRIHVLPTDFFIFTVIYTVSKMPPLQMLVCHESLHRQPPHPDHSKKP